jgi:hypothetical protein
VGVAERKVGVAERKVDDVMVSAKFRRKYTFDNFEILRYLLQAE